MQRRATGQRDTSRRRFLRAVVTAGAVGLAGCSQFGSGGDSSTTDGDDAGSNGSASPSLQSVSGAHRQSQFDAANSGYRTGGGVDGDGATGWTVKTMERGPAYDVGSPVVADGTVFVAEGGEDENGEVRGRVLAVDVTSGEEQWRYDAGGTNSFADPAVADGTLVQPVSGTLVALDTATGEHRWEFSADLDTGVTVADGTAYVLGRGYSDPMTVYAVDIETGNARWTHELNSSGGRTGAPAKPAVVDGTVYVANGSLVALSAADGAVEWVQTFDSAVRTPPTVSDGTVYLGGGGNVVRAVAAADGSQQWQTTVPSSGTGGRGLVDASLAVDEERAYVMHSWRLSAVSLGDGSPVWSRELRESYAPVVAGETVYVGGLDSVAALDARSGEGRWRVRTDAESGSPRQVAVVDGALFLGSGGLHAIA